MSLGDRRWCERVQGGGRGHFGSYQSNTFYHVIQSANFRLCFLKIPFQDPDLHVNGNKNILAQTRAVYLPILDACNDRVRLDISECFSYADGVGTQW